MHPPGRVSTSGGFPRSLPLSPSRPNRDALCATKHLARASSCLYVAAYSPSLPRLSLLFPSVLDSLSFSLSPLPPLPPFSISLILSLVSPSLLPPTRAPGESLSLDILRTFAPPFQVPNKISISDISPSVPVPLHTDY